ncbi:MAG: hypothetical protein PUD15_03200 [Prevotella sp.]|uniref:hypothetical protein n=1 Tax=Prevotella sp. AGR2160 TaxID=1280674 RepID=UPI0003F5760B|nr:hypothetical protein [Prevotella sp. AGR2160]MDD5861553.1 hypothetical protein [Prevotella sp.]
MKTRTFRLLAILLLATMAMPMQAQGLGGLLKKAKKALETVTSTTTTKSTSSSTATPDDQPSGKTIQLIGGGTLTNPLSSVMDVELVGVYGHSKSVNFGDVGVVLKIKMNEYVETLNYIDGGSRTIAFDEEGNSYMGDNTLYSVPVTEGVFVKIDMGEKGQHFKNVRKAAAKTFPVMKIKICVDYGKEGTLVFKDVPVTWDK